MKQLNSEYQLNNVIPNIATLLNRNVVKFSDRYVYQEKNKKGVYEGIKWAEFYKNIEKIAYNLKKAGFKKEDDRLPKWMTEEAIPETGAVFDVGEDVIDHLFDEIE